MTQGMDTAGPPDAVVSGGLVWDAGAGTWTVRDIHVRAGRFVDPPGDQLETQPATVVDARGRWVIPGLVNAHTHGHNNLLKGTGDCRWLEGHINAMTAVGQWSPRDLYVSTMLGAIEMLKTGTTSAYDMVRAPTDEHVAACVQAYADAGMRVVIAPAVSDLPFVDSVPGLAGDLPADLLRRLRESGPPSREVGLAFAERAVRAWHGARDGLIQLAVGPLIADVCSDELITEAAALARDLGVGTHMHLLESKVQALNGPRRGAGSPWVNHLDRLGYLGPESTLAHGVWLTPDEVALLAERGSTVVHNPASNLKIGSGLAPVSDYRRAGVTVALATDGAASGDTLDMFSAMWLAAMLSHSRTPDVDHWLTASDVFSMATAAGSRAMGSAGELGTIETGALADLVLVDPDSVNLTPANDAMTQLVYCGAANSVDLVMVAGRIVVRDRAVVGVDEAAILAEARETALRLGTAAGLGGTQAELQSHLDAYQARLLSVDYPVDRYTSR